MTKICFEVGSLIAREDHKRRMKKVLIIITTGFSPFGGLTSVMMNYYRAMDKKDLYIDIASTNEAEKSLLEELSNNGSQYYRLGDRKKNIFYYLMNLYRRIKQGRYDVVHVNGNSSTMMFELYIAKYCGVDCRIAHGHTTRSNYPKLHKLLEPMFKRSYTHGVAVSKEVGDWLFEDGYRILNNAIDLEHYKFSKDLRNEFRKKYEIDGDTVVVGNVGKLNAPKNQSFLLRVFAAAKKQKENMILVVVGGGGLENELKELACRLDISDSVIFLGMVNDTREAMQGMDVFVFTSIFEGLGMALIEAQAAGLPCISSDTVPKETKVSDLIEYVSLLEEPEYWARLILGKMQMDRETVSEMVQEDIRRSGYDIKIEADKLRKLYLNPSL